MTDTLISIQGTGPRVNVYGCLFVIGIAAVIAIALLIYDARKKRRTGGGGP